LIRSFRCKDTLALFEGRHSRKFHNIADAADKKLAQLHAAERLSDLARFPGNHLEALKGGRTGRHSVWINDQLRLVFTWREGEAYDVEIIDYH
jgi:proteic killer suppression protein